MRALKVFSFQDLFHDSDLVRGPGQDLVPGRVHFVGRALGVERRERIIADLKGDVLIIETLCLGILVRMLRALEEGTLKVEGKWEKVAERVLVAFEGVDAGANERVRDSTSEAVFWFESALPGVGVRLIIGYGVGRIAPGARGVMSAGLGEGLADSKLS